MRAYKIELLIIDFDEVGEEGIKHHIENARYPNHCLSPHVKQIEGVDIGEWDDDHPLNGRDTCKAEYERLFAKDADRQG